MIVIRIEAANSVSCHISALEEFNCCILPILICLHIPCGCIDLHIHKINCYDWQDSFVFSTVERKRERGHLCSWRYHPPRSMMGNNRHASIHIGWGLQRENLRTWCSRQDTWTCHRRSGTHQNLEIVTSHRRTRLDQRRILVRIIIFGMLSREQLTNISHMLMKSWSNRRNIDKNTIRTILNSNLYIIIQS